MSESKFVPDMPDISRSAAPIDTDTSFIGYCVVMTKIYSPLEFQWEILALTVYSYDLHT